jgi:hypothetical protein
MMVCATLWMTLTHQCSGNVSFRRKLGAIRLLKLLFYVNMNLWCPSDRRVASSMIVTFYLIYSLHFVMYIHGLGFIRFTMLVFMISIFSFNREYRILNAKWERERPTWAEHLGCVWLHLLICIQPCTVQLICVWFYVYVLI